MKDETVQISRTGVLDNTFLGNKFVSLRTINCSYFKLSKKHQLKLLRGFIVSVMQ